MASNSDKPVTVKVQLNVYLEERKREGDLSQDSPLFVSIGNNYAGKRLGYQG